MTITPRIELRTGQSLIMTPQMQQAIKLLQLSNVELKEFVETELIENPLLDRDEGKENLDENMEREHGGEDEGLAENIDTEHLEVESEKDFVSNNVEQKLQENEVSSLDVDDFGNVWDVEDTFQNKNISPNSLSDRSNQINNFTEYPYSIEQTIKQEISLREHILNQIQLEIKDHTDRKIAIFLTSYLDENGRISEDLSELGSQIGCDEKKIETILLTLQEFDPAGIFARTLSECWAIQLRDKDRLDPAMETLLNNIELLKVHDYKQLSQLCKVSVEDIRDMISEIWSLNHNPVELFNDPIIQPVAVDVLMRQTGNKNFVVELNSSELPKVLFNNDYYVEICQNLKTSEEKKYVAEKYQCANWLIKSLHQRATTILKVATAIVLKQNAFFEHGIEHLIPLALKDIAEDVEMHESTISRVTTNKYIDTPRGIFELKYFFSSALDSVDGDNSLSSEAVKHQIKKLIENENMDSILSDDKLVNILHSNGVQIARRTIAKYRESMKIPSSVDRRRAKRMIF